MGGTDCESGSDRGRDRLDVVRIQENGEESLVICAFGAVVREICTWRTPWIDDGFGEEEMKRSGMGSVKEIVDSVSVIVLAMLVAGRHT